MKIIEDFYFYRKLQVIFDSRFKATEEKTRAKMKECKNSCKRVKNKKETLITLNQINIIG